MMIKYDHSKSGFHGKWESIIILSSIIYRILRWGSFSMRDSILNFDSANNMMGSDGIFLSNNMIFLVGSNHEKKLYKREVQRILNV